eukprot:TRINITY_DN2887_c0_g1_i1.p1 TRINITY_DN2887_c0_g1~~TRINITY_DN2887_c0_g1_i1.p1  ORF type:complete len:302 (+),score=43.09 TRINITY_DN2887_c0_g1_i1:157-1062(+)
MAVRSGGNAALVSSVRQAIECPICCNPFTDPRILKCLHTFDLACLKSWAARATATAPAPLPDCMKRPASAPPPPPGVTSAVAAATAADTNKAPQAAAVGAYAPCPTCGEKFLADKVEGLPRNYIIEHIATIMKPVKTAPERFCDLTEHEQPTTAAFYCKNCTQHWQCEECFNFIHRSSKAKKHEYMSASSEVCPNRGGLGNNFSIFPTIPCFSFQACTSTRTCSSENSLFTSIHHSFTNTTTIAVQLWQATNCFLLLLLSSGCMCRVQHKSSPGPRNLYTRLRCRAGDKAYEGICHNRFVH